MARPDNDLTVTQSLVDRLIDRDPKLESDPSTTRAQSIRQLKAGVRRDLEWLLNSRRIPEPADETLKELSLSLYNYGLPDFTAMTVNSPRDRSKLLVELERSLALYEPRLKNIRVGLAEDPASGTRALRFQIEGLL